MERSQDEPNNKKIKLIFSHSDSNGNEIFQFDNAAFLQIKITSLQLKEYKTFQ